MKKIAVIFLCLALLLACAACEWEPQEAAEPEPESEPAATEPAPEPEPEPEPTQSWLTFDTYGQLFAAISEVRSQSFGYDSGLRTEDAAEAEEAPAEASAAAADDMAMNTAAAGGADYSTTNVQVEGVDEADIVKTDGQYIYILRNCEVTVVKAAGADTEELSSFAVCAGNQESSYEYASEMYLDKGSLYVVVNRSSWQQNGDSTAKTCLRRYDVSDPAQGGQLVYEVAQDGYYLTSRMLDGKIYLVGNYYIYSEPEETDQRTYVPSFYDANGKSAAFAIDEIAVCPGFDSVAYAVVSAINMEDGKCASRQTVLGAGSTVYMSKDNLYLAKTSYREESGEPYTESIYKVVDWTSRNYTNVVRFALSGGGVEMQAFTELEGSLSDQFALDEYEGNLRIALTAHTNKYKIYTDEDMGFENYLWDEDSDATDNSVYVLDQDLQTVGKLTGLAEDEWIRSVRFSGPVGYICTFETVDPLFAIDLSDPAAPKVLSALKIPGFSEYLHPWGKDKLIGLGYATTSGVDDVVFMDSVKLSMFDCSDLTDVQETDVYPIEGLDYSEALYNHKAVTASADKNLICFPGDGCYLLYAYDEGQGFRELARVSLDQDHWYDWNSRGLWSGDYFYVASLCGVAVLSMEDYSLVKEIYFDEVEPAGIVYTAD